MIGALPDSASLSLRRVVSRLRLSPKTVNSAWKEGDGSTVGDGGARGVESIPPIPRQPGSALSLLRPSHELGS